MTFMQRFNLRNTLNVAATFVKLAIPPPMMSTFPTAKIDLSEMIGYLQCRRNNSTKWNLKNNEIVN